MIIMLMLMEVIAMGLTMGIISTQMYPSIIMGIRINILHILLLNIIRNIVIIRDRDRVIRDRVIRDRVIRVIMLIRIGTVVAAVAVAE